MPELQFEMVPDGCWYSNLRTVLRPEAWDVVRRDAYARAEGRCMICGAKTARLEAHERWSYDISTKIQKLEEVVAICKPCHSVIHIGRTSLMGDEKAASEHYMKVNGATYAEYRHALGEANRLHAERNRVDEWLLDLRWLSRYKKI